MNFRAIASVKPGKGVAIAILAVVTCLAAAAFWQLAGGRKDFYNNLWAPAHLLTQDSDPYDTASLGTELAPLWLPPAVGTFAPLGLLAETGAARVWFLLSLAALGSIVFLSLARSASIFALLLLSLMAFFFPPVVNHLALGQFSILSALCCLLAALFTERKQPWPAAFLLALALAKPQLAFLAAAGLGFHHLQGEGIPGGLRFVLRLGAAALILSLPVLLGPSTWIQSLLANLRTNPAWTHPSLFTFLRLQAGVWAYPLWGLVLGAALWGCWSLWRVLPPAQAMPWTLGLTLLVSPYLWSWDFVLLLPLWCGVFSRLEWKRQSFLTLAYLAGWAGMAAIQLSADDNNIRFWWVPLWFMAALFIVPKTRVERISSRSAA